MIDIVCDLVQFRSKLTLKLLKSIDFESYFNERFNKNHQTIWLTRDITLHHQNYGEERKFILDAFGTEEKIDKVFVKVIWNAKIYKEIGYVLNEISNIIFFRAPRIDVNRLLTEISESTPSSYQTLDGKSGRAFLRTIVTQSIEAITKEFSYEI